MEFDNIQTVGSEASPATSVQNRKTKMATVLCAGMLGWFGVHRFYTGRIVTGILQLVTLGGFFIWWLIDYIRIVFDKFGDKDGNPLIDEIERGRTGEPAGFLARWAAYIYDAVRLALLNLPIVIFYTIFFDSGLEEEPDRASDILYLILTVGYYSYFHGGVNQATPGKRRLGIYVVRTDGSRIGYGRSIWRSFCHIFNFLTFGIGYLMAAFTKDKRALHDYIAGTRVIVGRP